MMRPPVWVAAMPARLYERAVRNRAGGSVGIRNGFRAIHPHRYDAMNAFAVAHDHLGQLEADVI